MSAGRVTWHRQYRPPPPPQAPIGLIWVLVIAAALLLYLWLVP